MKIRFLKYTISLIAFFCVINSNFAAETIIKGKVDGFNNKTIKIGAYKDFFTNEKVWVTSAVINNGSFKVSINLERTTQTLIKIEDKETSLFTEAGKVYVVNISYDEVANQGQSFNKFLNLNFPFPKAGECNQQIKKFNKAYQKFFLDNYKQLTLKGAKKETAAFIAEWKNNEAFKKNKFVANYIKYSIANLEDITHRSKKDLFKEYLGNHSILNNQKEYVNFFKQFYQGDFEQLCLIKESKELLKALMFDTDLDKSRKQIIKLKDIDNPALAELYLMYGLFEVYHKKVINQESSIKVLKKISQNGMTYPNQKIASNMIFQLQQFGRESKVVDFNLKNTDGKIMSLNNFKGKPIYLGFWSNSSIPSLREMRIIQKLDEKYGKKINFVSINLDEDSLIYINTKKKNNYNWTFLHYGNDFELREKYNIRTVPSYFLIDENGNMIQAFANGPTEIEKTLYELVK